MQEFSAPLGTVERTRQLERQAASLGIPPVSAPTNASAVQTFPSVQAPTNKSSVSGVADAVATTEGTKTKLDVLQKQEQDRANVAKQQAEALVGEQKNAKESVLNIFNTSPTAEETRKEAFKDIGVDPESYFADQKDKIARIESLRGDYAETKAKWERAAEARRTAGGGLASGTDTALSAIERDAAIELNMKSAFINAESAALQALQGNFAEAKSFANQAVDDFVYDRKTKIDTINTFYDMNQDSISRLDKQYQDALDESRTLAKTEYEEAKKDAREVMKLMLDYPGAGIKLSDSLGDATEKAGVTGGSTAGFTRDNINNGANNAGVTIDEFTKLGADVKNYFISSPADKIQEVQDMLLVASDSAKDAEEQLAAVDELTAPQSVKDYIKERINAVTPVEAEGGNWISGLWNRLFGE